MDKEERYSFDYFSTVKDNDLLCIKAGTEFVTSQILLSLAKSDVFNSEDCKLVKHIIVSIIAECMNELAILRSVNLQNDLGPYPDKMLAYMSIEDRYMGQENHAEFRINATNNNFDKLAKDINMLYVVSKEISQEIRAFGTYRVMQDTVHIIKRMHKEEEELLKDEANQEKVIKDLILSCEEERLENIRTIEETDSKIQQLRFQVEDIYIYGQHEVQFFDKWEKTRVEQNVIKCKQKEEHFETIIKTSEINIEQENRCNRDLGRYFEETRNDAMEGIQQWMKQYDEDYEKLELDIFELKTNLDKILEARKIGMETYAKRQAEIDDWLEYKKIKEAKEIQRMKEIQAATTIQAWWRGVMFRKKLGPYRKKKGKGKGKDKGKKTGNKK